MRQFWMKFIFEFLTIDALTTTTCACRVTSLDHKISDNTMENSSIIIILLRQFDEVFRCLRDFVREDLEGDITMIGVECDGRIGHIYE